MRYLNISILLLYLFIGLSCDKDKNNPVTVKKEDIAIKFEQNELLLVNQIIDSVKIELDGVTPFNWVVRNIPEWLTVIDSTGFSQGTAKYIRMKGNLPLYDAKTLARNLEIEVLGYGKVNLKTVLNISNEPKLCVYDSIINCDYYGSNIHIRNIGGGILKWNIINPDTLIKITQISGELNSAIGVNSYITINTDKMIPGNHTNYVKVCAGQDTISVCLNYTIKRLALLSAPKVLTIPQTSDEISYWIKNIGNNEVHWTGELWNNRYNSKIEPQDGKISSGDSMKITVHIDRTRTPKYDTEFQVAINFNSNFDGTISTNILLPYSEQAVTPFTYNILSAKYLKSKDEILIVTYLPNKILHIDFNGNITNSIDLPALPISVSNISDDKIIIAYNSFASSINVNNLSLIKNYYVSAISGSILLNKDWCYISPLFATNNYLIGLDLNTSVEYKAYSLNDHNPQIYGVKLWSILNNNSILITNPHTSPQEVLLVNTDNGVLEENEYFDEQDNLFNRPKFVAVSENDNRIYDVNGEIYKTDTTFHLHLLLSNEKIAYKEINDLAENKTQGVIAIIEDKSKSSESQKRTNVRILNYNSFSSIYSVELPDLQIYNYQTQRKYTLPAYGEFVFVNANASKLFTIIRPNYYDSHIKDNWGFFIKKIK